MKFILQPVILSNYSFCQVITNLTLNACEKAAIASSRLKGSGKKEAADELAVNAMREIFNTSEIGIEVVIGEGEMDEAPMLFIGERLGMGDVKLDLAVDPLEGTNSCANNAPNSMTTAAIGERGSFLKAPDCYMEKIASGTVFHNDVLHIEASIKENLRNLALYKKKSVSDIMVIMLDRERHAQRIAEIRDIGAKVCLIPDGDIYGIIATTVFGNGADLYLGSGGAPEGVLAAAAIKASGGTMMGRLLFETESQRNRAIEYGLKDPEKVLYLEDLIKSNVVFVMSGVTNGDLLKGVSICKKTGLLKCKSMIFSFIEGQKNVKKITNYL